MLCWVLSSATELARRGKLTEHARSDIAGAVSGMRAQANDLMSSLDRDLPFPYAGLISIMINLVTFIQATFTGMACASPAQSHVHVGADGGRSPIWYMWAWQIGCLFFLCVLYDSLQNVQQVLHNPFGSRALDVAHDTIASGIRRLATELMEGKSHAPDGWHELRPLS